MSTSSLTSTQSPTTNTNTISPTQTFKHYETLITARQQGITVVNNTNDQQNFKKPVVKIGKLGAKLDSDEEDEDEERNNEQQRTPINQTSSTTTSSITTEQFNHSLNTVLQTTQSPALALTLLGIQQTKKESEETNTPLYDQSFEEKLYTELEQFLQMMNPILDRTTQLKQRRRAEKLEKKKQREERKQKKSQQHGRRGSRDSQSSGRSDEQSTASNYSDYSEEKLEPFVESPTSQSATTTQTSPTQSALRDCFHHYTPLNLTVLPTLYKLHERNKLNNAPLPTHNSTLTPAQQQQLNQFFDFQPELPIEKQIERAVTERVIGKAKATVPSASSTHRPFISFFLIEPSATLTYLQQMLGLQHITEDYQSQPQRPIPNLIFLNEEVKLLKEQIDGIIFNPDTLKRTDALPYFETLCLLYNRLQPTLLLPFIQYVTHTYQQHPSIQALYEKHAASNTATDEQENQGDDEIDSDYENPDIQRSVLDHDILNYWERAINILPSVVKCQQEGSENAETGQKEEELRQQRITARCNIYQQSGHIVEAVLLRLTLARQEQYNLQHEEQAIQIAYSILTPPSQCAPSTSTSFNQTLSDEAYERSTYSTRAELFFHYLTYWLERQLYSTSTTTTTTPSQPQQHDDLDPRIQSLITPYMNVQSFIEIVKQHLAIQEVESNANDEDEQQSDKKNEEKLNDPIRQTPIVDTSATETFKSNLPLSTTPTADSSLRSSTPNFSLHLPSSLTTHVRSYSSAHQLPHVVNHGAFMCNKAVTEKGADLPIGLLLPQLKRFAVDLESEIVQ